MSAWGGALDAAARAARPRALLLGALCGMAGLPTSLLVFSQIFTNATPDHWCAPPRELEGLGLSEDLLRNLTIPEDGGSFERCRAYSVDPIAVFAALNDDVKERSDVTREGVLLKTANMSDKGQKEERRVVEAILAARSAEPSSCTNGWRFSTEHYGRTLVTDLNLVCEKEWLPRMCNSLFWVGSIFGNVFFGWMSDRYGRRTTILFMISLETPLAVVAAFSPTYWSYIVLRVLAGLFFPALYQLPFILALELMPPDRRTTVGIVVGTVFAGGMCLLALLAFAVRDWVQLTLATSLPFVVLYGSFWLIPESPRWLVGRGRIAEAEKVLRNLAKKNAIDLPRGFLWEIRIKLKEKEAAETGLQTLLDVKGRSRNASDVVERNDRRITSMITFQALDTSKANDSKNNAERISALGAGTVVNDTSKEVNSRKSSTEVNEDVGEEFVGLKQQSTQTDPQSTLGRTCIQTANTLLHNNEYECDGEAVNDENTENDGNASFVDIFRYPNLRKRFFILTFDWVALGVVYNSLSYNTPNLGVNDYLAFFIGGAVELPAYALAWRGMESLGRRWVLCACAGAGGLACLSCVLVPDALPWVTVGLAMLGRLCAAAAFAVFYVLIGELLPTVVRAQAMGAASFVAGLGLLACPYIVHLAAYGRALPLSVAGACSVGAALASLFLPETLRQPLPQTLPDGEAFGRKPNPADTRHHGLDEFI